MVSLAGKARFGVLLVGSFVRSTVWAAELPIHLPFDTPITVGGGEAVCTGVGQDSRNDARWNAYPLKVVLAGAGGQYLGDARLNLASQEESMMDVRCGGPWILFEVNPGRYTITATVNGVTINSAAFVPETGQGRIVLRFPSVGGVISPEHEPAND